MNLADSVKFVLKSKSQSLFSDLWKDDLKNLFSETKGDVSRLFKSASTQIGKIRKGQLEFSPREILDSVGDALTLFKIIPSRMKIGFAQFKDDFMFELEKLPDQKQKTIFCLKVMGALSRFIVGAIYNLRIGKSDFNFIGLKHRNAFTQFLVAELIFKVGQVFVMRFLSEVEKHLTDPDELNNVRYFKALFSDREKLENEQEALTSDIPSSEDRSIVIVDEFKNYILTGKRSLP